MFLGFNHKGDQRCWFQRVLFGVGINALNHLCRKYVRTIGAIWASACISSNVSNIVCSKSSGGSESFMVPEVSGRRFPPIGRIILVLFFKRTERPFGRRMLFLLLESNGIVNALREAI